MALDLSVSAQHADGTPAPDGSLTLSEESLTLPAGGSETVQLTLDTGVPGTGLYEGALVARTADGDSVRTPIGYHKEQEMYDVHVEGIARDGRPAYGGFMVHDVIDGSTSAQRYWREENDDSCTDDPWGTSACVRVSPGTYAVSGLVLTLPQWAPSTQDLRPFGAYLNTSLVGDPEVTVSGDTTLTLDARAAEEVHVDTPDHETKRNLGAAQQLMFHRAPENGPAINNGILHHPGDQLQERFFLQPTEPVTHGEVAAYTQWQLEAPAITLNVTDTNAVDLNPLYYDKEPFSDNSWQFPRLEGEHNVPVADAATATADDLAGRELDGALALVRRSDDISVADQSNNAADAGAELVAVYNDVPGSNAKPGETGVRLQVPTVRLSHAEGTKLLDLLSQRDVAVEAHGETASPYRYNLVFAEDGQIPDDLHYTVDADELAAVRNDFHSQLSDNLTLRETWFSLQPWEESSFGVPQPTLGAPRSGTDYYVGGDETAYSQNVITPEPAYNRHWPQPPQAEVALDDERTLYQPGQRVTKSWLKAPLRPGLWPLTPLTRTGDVMRTHLAAFTDGDGHFSDGYTSSFEDGFSTRYRVYADDDLILDYDAQADGDLTVPANAEDYRIVYDVDNAAPWARLSTRTRSVWTFGSSRPADGEVRTEPLLTVDYDIDVDLRNRAPSPAERKGRQTIGLMIDHQPGAPEIPIRHASLSMSYDSGESWREIRNVREIGDGRYVATLPRAPRRNDGFASLRIRAQDTDGNGAEQEIIRAYALTQR